MPSQCTQISGGRAHSARTHTDIKYMNLSLSYLFICDENDLVQTGVVQAANNAHISLASTRARAIAPIQHLKCLINSENAVHVSSEQINYVRLGFSQNLKCKRALISNAIIIMINIASSIYDYVEYVSNREKIYMFSLCVRALSALSAISVCIWLEYKSTIIIMIN